MARVFQLDDLRDAIHPLVRRSWAKCIGQSPQGKRFGNGERSVYTIAHAESLSYRSMARFGTAELAGGFGVAAATCTGGDGSGSV